MNDIFRPLSRREALRWAAGGLSVASYSLWMEGLAARAADGSLPKPAKKCILLWMDGGPAHLDTFDPKPEAGEKYRGEYGVTKTSVTDLLICDKLDNLAPWMREAAVIRGMSTNEQAEHSRARHYMHTGFKPNTPGGLTYPSLGALVSRHRPPTAAGVPNFIVTGSTMGRFPYEAGGGYLGPRHRGLILEDPERGLPNGKAMISTEEFDACYSLVEQLSNSFSQRVVSPALDARRSAYSGALQLMRSEQSKVFDLSQESDAVRDRYGHHAFGQGCLLARRLVEIGVPFVEVYLSDWDTHEKRRADLVKNELLPQVNMSVPVLLQDLKTRGLLEETLVVWMGEFGRTPKLGNGCARDHYVKAWSTVLFGGGIRGGQVIGRTDEIGAEVVDRPVSGPEFMATILAILGIDPHKELMAPGDRPIAIVDDHARPIQEIVG